MNADEKLRQDRLVFYKDEIARIDRLLGELLTLSRAKCAFLIDKEGHTVARTGEIPGFDLDTFSALVAGSFAATREMARLLGEQEFSVMYHQGTRDHIQLNLVDDRTILTVIFDDRTTVGMVRLYAKEAEKGLVRIFADGSRESESVDLGADYDQSARAKLDSLFAKP